MPEKNVNDMIQSLLEKNKGFMSVKRLMELLSADVRRSMGIKSGESGKNVRRKLEQSTGNSFMFHTKGNSTYILIPCEPSELVLGLLSEKRAFDTRAIRTLPFTKAEFVAVVNELVDEGRVTVKVSEIFAPRIYRTAESVKSETVDGGEYTEAKFREAFDALDMGRVFVRIPDLRRKLGWPREVFDDMLRTLRDNGTVQLHTGDASLMTPDEVADCFTDENDFRKGSVTWHGR